MASKLVLGLEFHALRTKGGRIQIRSAKGERRQVRSRDTKLYKACLWHIFDIVGEFVVEVGNAEPGAPVHDLLVDAAIELTSNTVRTLHRTRVSAPSQIGASEIVLDVPEVSETRLNQTVKDWPLGQTLLISAGIQPGILQDKNGFLNLRIPGTYPTSTELLIFLDAETVTRGRTPANSSGKE